ncbi:MAG TPA: protease inhibitor I42 family protein [Methanocella sp.]|jgi:inhibitor of cysteine peptidase
MVTKPLALFGLAVVVIAGMMMVSACTGTATPTATPSATPSVTPSGAPTATPLPSVSNNTTAAYGQSDNNKTVNVKAGETFTITLDENPSTGYSWNASVTSGLAIANSTYLPPNTTLVGAPGLHQWRITANATGDQKFNATYKRPFEPVLGNETAFVLNVKVIV